MPDLSATSNRTSRVIRQPTPREIFEAEARVFQASSAFVSACQEATVAMHMLTAKLRALEKGTGVVSQPKAKKNL